MIRALCLPDLVGVGMFLRRAGTQELTSHIWPRVQPETGHLPSATALWQTLGMSWERVWIAVDGRTVEGLLVARPRAGGLVWDVEHLLVADGHEAVAEELLEVVGQHAAERGGRRVFLEVPDSEEGAGLARRSGYERYTQTTVYQLPARFKLPQLDTLDARPRLRVDEQPLFTLYSAAVPQMVRSAEALTYDEWSALHRGRKKWSPTLIGDRHQYVWEIGASLAGWLEVVYGQKSQYLELLIDPKYESMVDRMLAFAMKQLSEKAPVYVSVRPYQSVLGAALERRGFVVGARYDIHVRQLSVRIPEASLVPANIVGG
ncbi:MAG: hypothetical protein AB7P40_05165 [Chloroflexota bacterium]